MKKLLIVCLVVSACVLVLCADSSVLSTPKTQELAWFDVSTVATNHGSLVANGDALCAQTDGKFEIDSDLANPVVFTADDALTQQMAKVTFNLDAAIVPNGSLQTFGDNVPKIAFALYQTDNTTTNFVAWVGGSEWITLTGGTIPTDGEAYDLTMEFDNSEGHKVRFTVGDEILKYNGEEWISYMSAIANTVAVNFVGCGKVASFVGKQIYISGEIVVIGDKGVIEINNEAKAAFAETIKDTSYDSVDAFLAADANTAFAGTTFQSGLTVAEAYALGLVEKDGAGKMVAKDNGELKVRADAQASTADGIPVNLNIQPPTDSGATITYQLQGSVDDNEYANIGAPTGDQDAIKIQTSNIGTGASQYRYFKVVTTVTLKEAQN